MYTINDPSDIMETGGVLVFVPFSTQRKTGVPTVPEDIEYLIPHARKVFEKIIETSQPRDTFYYQSNSNTYLFHRVKSSSKSHNVSMDMLNQGIDILESEAGSATKVVILGTGDEEADKYIKLLFKYNSGVFFIERATL